jgi:adenylate kinase family enzyme
MPGLDQIAHADHFAAMKRVVIVGCAGGGKSTLARRLGERLRLPVTHLDAVFWGPGWSELPIPAFRAKIAEITAGDAWITDGNYAGATFDLRLPRADLLIMVERPRIVCLWRAVRRALLGYMDRGVPLAPGCEERFDARFMARLRFIWNYQRVNVPIIEAARLAHGPDVPVVRLTSDAQIAAFLASAA